MNLLHRKVAVACLHFHSSSRPANPTGASRDLPQFSRHTMEQNLRVAACLLNSTIGPDHYWLMIPSYDATQRSRSYEINSRFKITVTRSLSA